MALQRIQKEEIIDRYTDNLARAQIMIWCNQAGLSVAEISDLRRRLREVGGEAVVIKNSLMCIALQRADLPCDEELMTGPNVVTFAYDDVPGVAKAVAGFVREHEADFGLKGGLLNGQVLSAEQVRALATLPPREVLLAQLMGGMQAPVSAFVGVLSSLLRSIMYVLNARVEQLESAPAGAPAEG